MLSYPRLSPTGLRGLSVVNIILWAFSNTIMLAISVRYSNFGLGPDYNDIGALDSISAGYWAGLLYGIVGMLGISASYERKRSQLTSVVVLNVMSIIGATTAGCIAGIVGFYIVKNRKTLCFPNEYPLNHDQVLEDCYIWAILEFTLLAVSALAAVINFTSLIITLVGLCGPRKTTGLVRMDDLQNAHFNPSRRPSAN